MFEDIDEVTINNANKAIKDVYAKFQNKAIQSIISKMWWMINVFRIISWMRNS